MDVDIGMGLGDDLGGFEGFDAMFAESNNTTDFFNFCALEDAQQEQHDAATTPVLSVPQSPTGVFGQQQRGHDFPAQESWGVGSGLYEQRQSWPSLTHSASEPTRNPSVLLHGGGGGGKPRARKRHDEDEALELDESAFPYLKRRQASTMALNSGPSSPRQGPKQTDHSFDAIADAGGWTSSGPQPKAGAMQPGVAEAAPAPCGGAIKVNTDVTSKTMLRPPRISVFMASSSRRRAASGAAGRGGGGGPIVASRTPSPMVMTPGAGGYGGQHQLEPNMDRNASAQAQRLRDLRISTRARSMAEEYVVKHTPPVVAMGSQHHPSSTSALLLGEDGPGLCSSDGGDGGGCNQGAARAPTLRRASSVGALTIAGSAGVLSTSPVLSATGTIIQSCELSDRAGEGGKRRNLVCKVFGSGRSPCLGPSNRGGQLAP